jgi:hypothetical protein
VAEANSLMVRAQLAHSSRWSTVDVALQVTTSGSMRTVYGLSFLAFILVIFALWYVLPVCFAPIVFVY